MTVTTDLAKFGTMELKELKDILTAWLDHGLPDNFNIEGVVPHMNQNSGYVFLANEDYQVAMLNRDKLELYHSCSYCGYEGFLEDFEHEPVADDCKEQMQWAGVPSYSDYIQPID